MFPSPDTSARATPSLQWVPWPPLAGALRFPTFIDAGSEVSHRVAPVLATVRRSNVVCSLPAPRFHKGALFCNAVEGISITHQCVDLPGIYEPGPVRAAGSFEHGRTETDSSANSGFNETQGQFSPHGRWVAYASDESSRFEIYVVPFPPGDGRTGKSLLSSAGRRQPRWRADGKELYYLGLDGSVMAVDTKTDPAFQAATPHALFRPPTVAHVTNLQYRYDATRDGKKFLMVNALVGEPSSPVTVMLNWRRD